MSDQAHKEYPDISDLSKEALGSNNSITKMLSLVGNNKRVIDFGCATGYFARFLREEGCSVVGVEINPDAAKIAEQYCDRVIVADLDYTGVNEIIGEEKFDVATFGDILEHLKDPWQLLKSVQKLLNPEGYIVASIPNIAHGSIRLALLKGDFDYQQLGLLDNTHLRFFTRKSVRQLFEETGYFIEVEDSTLVPIFHESPVTPTLDVNDFRPELIDEISQDENSEVLQFIIRAYPWSMAHEYGVLRRKYDEGQVRLEELAIKLQQNQSELQQSQSELQQIRSELQQSQLGLQQTQSELQQTQSELQQTQSELQQTQSDLLQNQTELQQTQSELNQEKTKSQYLVQTIQAMETSKFWKIRNTWVQLKRLGGRKNT